MKDLYAQRDRSPSVSPSTIRVYPHVATAGGGISNSYFYQQANGGRGTGAYIAMTDSLSQTPVSGGAGGSFTPFENNQHFMFQNLQTLDSIQKGDYLT